jgi:AAA15 family ATPase/GTPase
MIIEFSVQNYRSIKELQTISFVATGLKSSADNSEVDTNNIAEEGGNRLLKAIGVYGANASGKSNIVRAFVFFLIAIRNEASTDLNLLFDPFLYQENDIDTVSFFQMVLIINNKKYRYGFTVKRNTKVIEKPGEVFSRGIIESEWLFGTKEKNVVELFTRTGSLVNKDRLPNKENIPNKIPYEQTLFLTHAAAFDSEGECALIRSYIQNYTNFNYLVGESSFRNYSIALIEDERIQLDFLELLSSFGLNYEAIKIDRDSLDSKSSILPREKVFLAKSFKNKMNENNHVLLNLEYTESEGTKKLFDLIGMLWYIFNLEKGTCVVLDEIDSNFHPSLLIKLIGMFNNPEINKSNSQLLFTSHDTNLMSPSIMRRDQFYFAEKNEDESTRIYSLADLRGIKNDADFAKQYLAGFYGALPVLNDYINPTSTENE